MVTRSGHLDVIPKNLADCDFKNCTEYVEEKQLKLQRPPFCKGF